MNLNCCQPLDNLTHCEKSIFNLTIASEEISESEQSFDKNLFQQKYSYNYRFFVMLAHMASFIQMKS